MSRPRIVLTRRWPAAVEDVLRERYDLVANADDPAVASALAAFRERQTSTVLEDPDPRVER